MDQNLGGCEFKVAREVKRTMTGNTGQELLTTGIENSFSRHDE